MARTLGSSPWLASAGILGLAMLLSGSYCSWRGYYVPASLGGSASTQTSIGPVSAFASVFVDGVEFTDSSATLTIDGVSSAESQFRVGQIATVGGGSSGSTGTANSIQVTTKLVGPVSAVDLAAATVTVLGQTVQLTGDTSVGTGISPTDVGGLVLGSLVAVDGYRTSAGLIASRFDLAGAGQLYQVAGSVTNLDIVGQTFTVEGTTIDYSLVSGGLPAGVGAGSYVVAGGGTATSATTLQAATITAQTEVPTGASGTAGAVHGAVTSFTSASSFSVGGQAVATTATTTYTSGVSTDVAPDVELEVVGTYDANGILDATSIALAPAANVRVEGAVQSIDTAGQTLTVAGITLGADAETRWDDRSATLLRTFGLTTVSVGDWVIVRGAEAGGTTASARVVERWTAPATPLVELQDVATTVSSPTFTLTGITVSTVGATFTDVNGASLTAANFFALLPGRLARASGTLSATGALLATSVQLRD